MIKRQQNPKLQDKRPVSLAEMQSMVNEEIAADRRAHPGRRARVLAALAVAAAASTAGTVVLADKNQSVPISGSEIERAQEAFLNGAAGNEAAYGQIEAKISDGSRVGFVLEQCPAHVFAYDERVGWRKKDCELAVTEVADGMWLAFTEGDFLKR